MNPLNLYVLYTYTTTTTGTGCRTYLYSDQSKATADGERLKAAKPTEATAFGYMVLPLEGPPS